LSKENTTKLISSRKLSIRLNGECFDLLAKNLNGVFFVFDLTGKKWIYISPAVETLRGYTVDETYCQSINEILTEAFAESIEKKNEERVNAFLSNPESNREYYDEVESLSKDNATVKLGINSFYQCEENGNVLLFGLAKNISKQIPDENILESKHFLSESGNSLLRTLIDHLPDRIFYKDKESRFILNNKAHIKALGKNSQGEVFGKTDFDFRPACDAEKFIEDDRQVIRTGIKIENKEELTVDISGGTHWCLVSKVPVTDSNKNIIGLIGISRDITERKKNEEAIKRQNEELTLINAEKDKFFSIIAHDLRSPFQGFINLTKLMCEEYSSFSKEQMLEMNNSMHKSAINLYKLLENLLEWSSVKRGTVKYKPAKINICTVINANLEMLIQVATLKEIEIQQNLPASLHTFADEKMIGTVVRNLISNAIKFTERGGKIFIAAIENEAGDIEIKVKDTGLGIDGSNINKLFRIDEKINTEGTEGEPSTGLGLFLCNEFIRKHNGTIKVESEVGVGSTFTVTLPKQI